MAQIEFYEGDARGHMAVLKDAAVPRVGEFISIRKITYRVESVTWAVVHADEWHEITLRANVVLSRVWND